MLRRIAVFSLWLVATLGTASLTYAAVSSAGRAVGEDPSPPVAGADIAARISTTLAADTTTTVTPTTPGDAVPPSLPSTTIPGTVTTTTSAGVATTAPSPGTSVPPTTQATTTHWKTVPGVGTVGVAVSGTSVSLLSATPVAPYQVDVKDDGPEKVEVEFDSDGPEYQVRAEVRDGQLVWSVESEGGSGDDG